MPTKDKRRRPPGPGGRRRGTHQGAPASNAPAVLILNPTASRGRAGRAWRKLAPELRHWSPAPEVVATERAGHGAELARAAVASGAGLVIAAGGDGTAHEVVQGLMEAGAPAHGTAFAHLPLGTGCDLARGLGLPTDPRGILRNLRGGPARYIDIGIADMSAGGGAVRRYFLNAATVGLGPAVARRVKGSTTLQRLGRYAYTVASLREIFSARACPISWQTDNGLGGDEPVLHMFINNGPSVAGGMRPSPQASFTSGELHVVVVGALGLAAALRQFRRLDRELPFDHPDIRSFRCRSIDLAGAELEVETDGEIAAGLPARLWVRAGGLLVRMPA